jgi:hypothetical protein
MNRTGMPKLYQSGYERAINGKASPRQAIKAQCLECVGYERNEITNCTDTDCPLYCYRPFQKQLRYAPQLRQTPLLRGFEVVESTDSAQGVSE